MNLKQLQARTSACTDSRAVCKSYNKSITALLWVGQYGGIFSSRLLYCPSLRSGQYCQPRTEYSPVLPSQSCSNIYVWARLALISSSHPSSSLFYFLSTLDKNQYSAISTLFHPGGRMASQVYTLQVYREALVEENSLQFLLTNSMAIKVLNHENRVLT